VPEDPKARLNRELIELLNEIRVALPGVQVLFAFLLVLPFQQGFANVTGVARIIYFVGLASSLVAIALLIAPAAYHRVNLRRGPHEKEVMLMTSSRLAVLGTIFLGLGIVCSLYVVADVLFGDVVALVAAIAAGVLIASLWYVLPLSRRRDNSLR